MTSVLKVESLAGENYETILEGARSLVTGLGSMLRVTSFEAKAYDSQNPHQDSTNYRRRRSTRNETSLVSDIFVRRQKRSTINKTFDEKLQVNIMLRVQGVGRCNGCILPLKTAGHDKWNKRQGAPFSVIIAFLQDEMQLLTTVKRGWLAATLELPISRISSG